MATVFDELRTMLDLPYDTEPFALGAACLGEIKKLRNAQNVHTAEIKAWRAENRQLRDKIQELRDESRQNIRTVELQRAENAVLSANLDRSHAEGASLRSLASSRWFQLVQLRRQLARQQSRCGKYKNRVRHHLHAREAEIGRMRKRLEQPPTSAEGAHHERELLAWLSEKDQAAERLMRIISERNQEIQDLRSAQMPKRQVVQLHDWNHFLVALCSDGTVWYRDHTNPSSWVEIVPPPTA